jgi:hypothetical protein
LVGTLHYARHFALLASAAAVLTASHGVAAHGPMVSFAVYGAVHASTIVIALRASPAMWRRLSFIAIAAALSTLSALLGVAGSHFLTALPGTAAPCLLLTLSSGIGAACYASLIRYFWIPSLTFRTGVLLTFSCMAAAIAAFLIAVFFLNGAGGLWFALWWWFAFSVGLWQYGGGRRVFRRGIL